jgi:dethiobiotin synthetase
VVIAARPSLGTINHSLLTLKAARAAGLRVCSVVLTPWPRSPSELEHSNRESVARMGQVDVHGLPAIGGPAPDELARAGATLPWRQWLAQANGRAAEARDGRAGPTAAPIFVHD